MHLFLVDSSIFIFKAWFGTDKTLVNLEQQPNQAFIGFTDFVYRLLTEQAPGKIVFAFDETMTRSARKAIYPEYKANRSPTPDALVRQFAWCRHWIDALGMARVSSSEWEADDLIGSLARYHRSSRLPVTLLTADKDLTQLIAEGDLWWAYPDKKLDYRAIIKKFGVRPEQIADLLALMGDKVDNIPGIPGVGRKTAANLLKKFHTLDELRLRLPEVRQMKMRYAMQVQQALIENQAILGISAQLTRINCGIEAMRQVDIERKAADSIRLAAMMREQAMDADRQARWYRFLETPIWQAG